MNQVQMIKSVGFNKVVTAEGIKAIEGKTSKASQQVIERIANSEYYMVFTDGENFTINSRYMVTKQEIKQFEQVLKMNFIQVGNLIQDNGLWIEWCSGISTGEETDVAESPEAVVTEEEVVAETITTEDFDQCLKEAQKLTNGEFIPELDNLVDNTIQSIVNKVLHEIDIAQEGETNVPKRKIVQAGKFVNKWIDTDEPEAEGTTEKDADEMYMKRNLTMGEVIPIVNNYNLETKREVLSFVAVHSQYTGKTLDEMIEKEIAEITRLTPLLKNEEIPEVGVNMVKELIRSSSAILSKFNKCKKLLNE